MAKPMNIPTVVPEKQGRIGVHFVGSPCCLSNTPGTPEGTVGSFEDHFFINCEELKLTKYISTFNDQDVDFGTLLTLNDGDLKEVGISLFGPRRKYFQHYPVGRKKMIIQTMYLTVKLWRNFNTKLFKQSNSRNNWIRRRTCVFVAEGCLMEEKAKRQEIYIRVCNVKELWKQVKGEVETLKALCQEMAEGNCELVSRRSA
ncbi:Ankyrin repeat and SAM domain-containing protein 3 [Desmophyllum pertusum]|uniref:Ankyrin repeat and SAM domain-containing protein 3 n=1 Tax=Desmophyllum pertusum TaxID=174260 RepID=A0A9W9YX29_9CNID|nr:Ankyrin repeat and SAM domain-containing protein 3 [Desmophyllum pertusum]